MQVAFGDVGGVFGAMNEHMIPGLVLRRAATRHLLVPLVIEAEYGVHLVHHAVIADLEVLDNTLVWICSEVSDGANHHSDTSTMWIDGAEWPTYLPNMLIGGAAGCLKPGVVDVTREHADVLATVAAMLGVNILRHRRLRSQEAETSMRPWRASIV